MELERIPYIDYRKRAWDQHREATDSFSSPQRPLSLFSMTPWPGVLGGLDEFHEFSKRRYLEDWAQQRANYDVDPFIPADEGQNPVTQEVWINTYGPLGQSSILSDGRLVFGFRGIDVLRRVARDDPYATVEQVTAGEVFVKGFYMKQGDHAYREELLGYLRPDYRVANTEHHPRGGVVTCLTLSDLKAKIAAYVSRVRQLRRTVSAPKAESFELADHQRTIYGWSRPTTTSGGSQAAAGIEALFALCVRPQDLYDLFRPIGICFTGKKKVDAECDLVTLLSGGQGKMLVPFMDDSMCKKGTTAPYTFWLVYQQKNADIVESANGYLDYYPDVDLVITDKPRNAFLGDFMSNTGHASFSSRDNPREITPFIFLQVAITLSRSYPSVNDETEVFMTLAGQSRPIVLFPSRLKSH